MIRILYFILIGFITIGCGRNSGNDDSSEQDQLPAATQTGANTAGCYINGKLLVPKNGSQAIGGSPKYGLTASHFYGGYYFTIKNYSNNDKLFIYIVDISNGIGDYQINQSNGIDTPSGNQDQNQAYLETNNKVYLSSNLCGIIKISKLNNPIISGTFSATLYNKDNPSEKIQITDGRFDINIATLNK